MTNTNSISNLTRTIGQLNANLRGNRRTLHLVQQVPDFLQVGQMGAVRVKRSLALRALWQGVDQ